MDEGVLLEFEGLNVNRGSRNVLCDIDFQLKKGEVVALVGDNGSGKTTFIESCTGIVPFKKGVLLFHTRDDSRTVIRNSEGRKSNLPTIGLTLQNDGICGEETVEERLLTSLHMQTREVSNLQITNLLSDWGLDHRKSDRNSQLSGGLRRRLSVLSGLSPAIISSEPIVILLDEPSEGLDENARKLLINWVRALASKNHGIIIASHDKELISCADRIIKIQENGTITESNGSALGDFAKLPEFSNDIEPISMMSLVRWSTKMEFRNPIDTVGRLTPALIALLLTYSLTNNTNFNTLSNDILAPLILLPGFITCIIAPALINRFNEAECGKWWHVMLGVKLRPISSFLGASILLPLPLTYLSWFVLVGDNSGNHSDEVMKWLWLPALSLIDVAIAASALHFLVADLHRSNAASGSLLLIVLVWPFLELSNSLSVIMSSGMSFSLEMGSPLISCIIASLSSSIIWLVVIFLPDA